MACLQTDIPFTLQQGRAVASEEKERSTTEPAALGKPSLQLDALLLVLTAVAASGTTQQPSGLSTTTTKLLRLRQIMSRFAKSVLASRPEGMRRVQVKSRWKAVRLLSQRRLAPLRPASQPHHPVGLAGICKFTSLWAPAPCSHELYCFNASSHGAKFSSTCLQRIAFFNVGFGLTRFRDTYADIHGCVSGFYSYSDDANDSGANLTPSVTQDFGEWGGVPDGGGNVDFTFEAMFEDPIMQSLLEDAMRRF